MSSRTTLVVTNDFPPRIGGIENFVAQVCRLLDDDVVVLTSAEPGADAYDRGLGFPVVRSGRVLLPTRATADRAAALLREHDSTRVVFGAAAPLGLLAPTLRAAGATRMLALSHGHEVWWARVPGARAALRRIGDEVDAFGVVSDFTRSRIATALHPSARVRLLPLPPPVDLAAFRPGRVVPGRVLGVGRLIRQKGFDVLLRAWAALPSRAGRELVIVGDGPQRSRLERLARRLDLDVSFAGAVPHEGLPSLLGSAQVVALPVRTRLAGLNPEGLGLTALEAAACGRPVLVGRSGGAPETVRDGVTGHALDPLDVDVWAGRLDALLADPAGCDRLGAAGRAHVTDAYGLAVVGRRLRTALALP